MLSTWRVKGRGCCPELRHGALRQGREHGGAGVGLRSTARVVLPPHLERLRPLVHERVAVPVDARLEGALCHLGGLLLLAKQVQALLQRAPVCATSAYMGGPQSSQQHKLEPGSPSPCPASGHSQVTCCTLPRPSRPRSAPAWTCARRERAAAATSPPRRWRRPRCRPLTGRSATARPQCCRARAA